MRAKLTPEDVKNFTKRGHLSDGGGLLLQVAANGSKSWTYRYQLNKVRRDKGIGPYPLFSLKRAREQRDEFARLVKQGIDPVDHCRDARIQAAAASAKRVKFADACAAFMELRSAGLKTEKQMKSWNRTFAAAGAVLGGLFIHEATRQHIVACLKDDWTVKNATAVENMLRLHALFKWSIVRYDLSIANPASLPELQELLPKVSKETADDEDDNEGRAALPWSAMPECMTKVRAIKTMPARAMEFIILTGARLEEALNLTWSEIDLKAKKWTVHKARMKAGKTQTVPLAAQAVDLLKALPSYNGGNPDPDGFVFTAPRGGKLYGDKLLDLLRDELEYTAEQVTTHGMRKSLRTYVREVLKADPDVCESVIAHDTRSKIRKTYERTNFYTARVPLMQDWANFTDERIAKVTNLADKAAA
ncbi:phage integrase family protein [Paraburkholderia sp. BL8N3]|nr:site-specific integrase [Paraburkholderia sp. BL8N3]TCK38006.1 phage integrase family protein [Paraburkholderia sp. BL8N3]